MKSHKEIIDYKKAYEEKVKEIEEIKRKNMSTKEGMIEEIARMFKEEPREEKSYDYYEEGKRIEKKYTTFNSFYEKVFSRLDKDTLSKLILKLKKALKEDEI